MIRYTGPIPGAGGIPTGIRMPLTDIEVRNAKPRAESYTLKDGEGLYLLVTPNGSKLWRLKGRVGRGGKQKLLGLGAYPEVSLLEARNKRHEMKAHLKAGRDPVEIKRQEKMADAAAQAQTFGRIAEEYLAKQEAEGLADATVTKNRWLLEDLASPLKDRPIREITAAEILLVLQRVEARGARESATRLRSAIGRVFRYAVATARAGADPTWALRGALVAPRVRHRPAVASPEGVGQLMRAIEGMEGSLVVRSGLKIMALCFPRPGELRYAEWADIDLEAATWTIPAERTKMRRQHVIPLAPQAVAIFRELHKATGHRRLVFPGVRNANVPMSENTLNAALRRLGYSEAEMTAHGFRATASTLLNESRRWHVDAIERALAHVDSNKVRRAYARGEHWDERVKMAEWWADHLDELTARPTQTDAA
jgi:integrase